MLVTGIIISRYYMKIVVMEGNGRLVIVASYLDRPVFSISQEEILAAQIGTDSCG